MFLRRRGGTCFPLFRGLHPPPGHLGPALRVTCFGLDLTRALSLRLLADGGGGCCSCSCGAFSFLWATLHHHHHLSVPAGGPNVSSFGLGLSAAGCFILPGKVIRAESHKSFSLDETSTAKPIPASEIILKI